nr:uncharacterized protein LOC110567448 [Aotus nancymaae]
MKELWWGSSNGSQRSHDCMLVQIEQHPPQQAKPCVQHTRVFLKSWSQHLLQVIGLNQTLVAFSASLRDWPFGKRIPDICILCQNTRICISASTENLEAPDNLKVESAQKRPAYQTKSNDYDWEVARNGVEKNVTNAGRSVSERDKVPRLWGPVQQVFKGLQQEFCSQGCCPDVLVSPLHMKASHCYRPLQSLLPPAATVLPEASPSPGAHIQNT